MNPLLSQGQQERGAAVSAAAEPLQAGKECGSALCAENPSARAEDFAQSAKPHSFKALSKESPIAMTRQNLPHWSQEGCTYFVTFRLGDALPQAKLRQWRQEMDTWLQQNPKPWTREQQREHNRLFEGTRQKWLDAGYGSCALRHPDLRRVMEEALHYFDGDRYLLGDYVIMPNHVHVLFCPLGEWPHKEITKSWKKFTGRVIQQRMKECGFALCAKSAGKDSAQSTEPHSSRQPFWQHESFDHIVRSPAQLAHYRRYIRENPEKASLKPGQWTHWEHPMSTAKLCGLPESGCYFVQGVGEVPGRQECGSALCAESSAASSTQAAAEAGTDAAQSAAPHSFAALLALLVLLFSLLPAAAQTDFARPATSMEFDLNTITTSASAAATNAGEFNLDTRAQTPDLTGGSSSGFFIDTRNVLPTGLVISGPATISSGGTADYRVVWQPPTGPQVDVTLQSTLGFVGLPPAGSAIGGWTVFAGRVAVPTSFQIRARYRNGAGQVFSTPFTVNIQPTLLLTMRATVTGTPGAATLTLLGTAAGGAAPYTITWDTDGDGAYDDASGGNVTLPFNRPAGTNRIRGRAEDANALTATGTVSVTLNAPPVANEPPITRLQPDAQIGLGTLKDADGNPLVLDAAKTANGLVIIVHGLDINGRNDLTWMRSMASSVRQRCAREGRPEPQIVLYEWPANPSEDSFADRVQVILNHTRWAIDLADYFKKNSNHATRRGLARFYQFPADWIQLDEAALILKCAQGIAALWQFVYDLRWIKPRGLEAGFALADWIADEAQAGNIDSAAPTHFIGHSAGGFVVTQAGVALKDWVGVNGKSFASNAAFLITNLDTPVPTGAHFGKFPQPGRIERYITQFGGPMAGVRWTQELETVVWSMDDFEYWDGSTWFPKPTVRFLDPPRAPGRYYQRVDVSFNGSLLGPINRHSYAHAWYAATVRGEEADRATQGFYFSPILGNRPFPGYESGGGNLRAPRGGDPSPADVCLTMPSGTFGSVTAQAGGLTMTEQGNAGAWFEVTVPEFAYSLSFSYRYQTGGDGDFLSVEIEGDGRQTAAPDTSLSREQFLSEACEVRHFAGQPVRLIFRLMSRGEPNAVVEVKDICFKLTNDADGDGLANTTEVTAGTDPYEPDTEFDGLSDADELLTHQTSPLLSDTDGDGQEDRAELNAGTDPLNHVSVFEIVQAERNPLDGSVALIWSTSRERLYRVVCADSLDGEDYAVVSPDIESSTGVASFTHVPDSNGAARKFYWIECLKLE
jgi:putative transposase